MENSGDSTLDIPLKLASVIDLDTQEYKSQALRNLQSIEDDSFKYIEEALSIDFENRLQEFHQSVDMNFQNSRSELISRIEEISKTAPTSLTQLPYTETTSYGDEVTYTLSANETTSLTVDITVTNENGTQLSGVGKASLNGETIYEDESSYLDLSGKLVGDMYDLNISTIKDGIEGSGTIYGENSATIEAKELKIGVANRYVGVVESGEYHFEGEIEGNIEHSYLNGEISKDDFNFKGEIETTFMFYDYGTTSSDSGMIDESEKVFKSEDVSILGVGTDLISQYATDEDMAENESMEDMIYTTAEDYIEDGNFSSIVDEYGEEAQAYINDGLETIEDYENLISNREINTLYINGTVINGDRETTLTLKEDMKSISISNLSMKFGDEATLSFENATIDGIVTTYLSDSGVAISYPETSTDGVEDMLLRRAIKSDADFPQVPTVQPELQDEDIVTTTAVLEDSGDIPPALPDNAGEGTDVTDPNTVIVHEPIEEPMPKPIVDIVNSPAVNISNINLSVNSEFGEFNFAGSYSIAEGFVRREGVSTLDEVKVDGIIMGALADENSIISQDIVLTTEDVTDLKFRVADIDGEVGMTLGFEDGYQIFIKDNHTNLTAVDSNGGTFETTSIAE